jgi:hypothetical protein
MIFNRPGFEWQKVVEEVKSISVENLRTRAKDFSFDLNNWVLNPLGCMGVISGDHG